LEFKGDFAAASRSTASACPSRAGACSDERRCGLDSLEEIVGLTESHHDYRGETEDDAASEMSS
jgi:hypothetical protein